MFRMRLYKIGDAETSMLGGIMLAFSKCPMECAPSFRVVRRKSALLALAVLAMVLLLACAIAMPAQAVGSAGTVTGNMDRYIGLGKKVAIIATSDTVNAKTRPIYAKASAKSKVVCRLQGRSCVVCDMRGMKKGKYYEYVRVKLPGCKPSHGYVRTSQFKFGTLDVALFGLSSVKGGKVKRITACKYGMKLIGARYSHSNSTNKAIGLSCIQLVRKCYNRAGISYYKKKTIPKSKLRACDVVYYRGIRGGYHGHVGMYIGNGYVLQSSADRGVHYPRAGVRITKLTFRSSPQGYASPLI